MNLAFLLFRHYKSMFIFSSLIGLVSGAANIVLLAIISQTLARYEQGAPPTYGLTVFAVVAVFATVFGIGSGIMNLYLSTKLSHNLRLNMADQIMNLTLREQERVGYPRLVATFTQDIPSIAGATMAIPGIVMNLGMSVGGLIYLGILSMPVLIGLCVYLVFCIVSYLIPERYQIRLADKARESRNRMLDAFNAMNLGTKELKLHYRRRADFYTNVMSDSAEEVQQTMRNQGVVGNLVTSWLGLMYFVFIAVLVFIFPTLASIDAVTLVGYALVVLFIRAPVMALIGGRNVFRTANIAFKKTEEAGLRLLATVGNHPFSDRDAVLKRIDKAPRFEQLRLEAVVHRFPRADEEQPFTLGPIDLTINAGDLVFLVGGNGSGKTTLAKLLTGLYIPESGRLLLNGKPLLAEDPELHRQYFSAVFNDFYVFEQMLGLEQDSLDEKAAAYLKRLHLDHKVTVRDGKLSSTNLSTGQRKRLALLTAYLEDRPVYVFDEWAADQDPEFKNVFYHQILPDLKGLGKTVIVISHDDRYFEGGDRLVRLVDGKMDLDT